MPCVRSPSLLLVCFASPCLVVCRARARSTLRRSAQEHRGGRRRCHRRARRPVAPEVALVAALQCLRRAARRQERRRVAAPLGCLLTVNRRHVRCRSRHGCLTGFITCLRGPKGYPWLRDVGRAVPALSAVTVRWRASAHRLASPSRSRRRRTRHPRSCPSRRRVSSRRVRGAQQRRVSTTRRTFAASL
jgi:hypothetical protein